MRGGMVGQDAPSRPIRVTVAFAGAPYHRTALFPSRSEMRVQLAACMARPRPGWKAAQKIQCDPRARARRSGLAGGFGQAKRPGLFLGRATARPSGDRRSPGSTRKCCAQRGTPIFRASCLGLCRRGPRPFVLDFPVARFPPCPRREAVQQESSALRASPLQDRPDFQKRAPQGHHHKTEATNGKRH